jgi:hypothetical protein
MLGWDGLGKSIVGDTKQHRSVPECQSIRRRILQQHQSLISQQVHVPTLVLYKNLSIKFFLHFNTQLKKYPRRYKVRTENCYRVVLFGNERQLHIRYWVYRPGQVTYTASTSQKDYRWHYSLESRKLGVMRLVRSRQQIWLGNIHVAMAHGRKKYRRSNSLN